MGSGLLGSLMGVRAERDGISAGAMGLTMAMYYVGFHVKRQRWPLAFI